MKKKPEEHRGRIQAQGGGTEKAVSWTQTFSPSRTQGLMTVIILENKLTKKERKDKEIPLIKAKNWINSAAQEGEVSAYVHVCSFPIQMATLSARCHFAQCPLVLSLCLKLL